MLEMDDIPTGTGMAVLTPPSKPSCLHATFTASVVNGALLDLRWTLGDPRSTLSQTLPQPP